MKIRGTDFVMFQVTDLPKAARFYRETLGLTQEVYSDSEEGGWAEFNCGNVTLSLNPGVKIPGGMAGGRIALAGIEADCCEYRPMPRLNSVTPVALRPSSSRKRRRL